MNFLERLWAYITLGAMGFVVEEAAPLFGGVQAWDRHLHIVPVIAALSLGTWVTGLALYGLGRAQSRSVRKRFPKLRPLVLQAAAIVRRHPWRAALGVRFAFGLRIPLPIACGVARMPIWLFFTASAISCFVWSAIFSLTGFYLAQFAEGMVGQVTKYVPMIGTILVALMFAGAWWMRRRHVAEKTKRVLDKLPLKTPPLGQDAIKP
jgi:membrane protein DedA with SNARE-associated domain